MSIKSLSENTANEIVAALGADASKAADVSKVIEKTLLEVVRTTRTEAVDVVNVCCSADQDLAHKIADRLRLKEKSIIANLLHMR